MNLTISVTPPTLPDGAVVKWGIKDKTVASACHPHPIIPTPRKTVAVVGGQTALHRPMARGHPDLSWKKKVPTEIVKAHKCEAKPNTEGDDNKPVGSEQGIKAKAALQQSWVLKGLGLSYHIFKLYKYCFTLHCTNIRYNETIRKNLKSTMLTNPVHWWCARCS